MRLIYEHVEGMAYLELLLTPKEIAKLTAPTPMTGPVQEFPTLALLGQPLNVFIRKELNEEILEEEEYAPFKRQE